MIFDTDVLIWVQRGNVKAARLIDAASARYLSVQTSMELIQCARDKVQQRIIKRFLCDFNFTVLRGYQSGRFSSLRRDGLFDGQPKKCRATE